MSTENIAYVGIDQSFRGAAIVALDKDRNLIEFNVFKTHKDDFDDMFDRAMYVSSKVNEFAVNLKNKYNDVLISLEGLAFGARGNAVRDLAGLQYTIVVGMRTSLNMKEFAIYSPPTIKKLATGGGKTDGKYPMIEALPVDIQQTFIDNGYKKTTGLADLADAYWIAVNTIINSSKQ